MSGRRIADLAIKISGDSYQFEQTARSVEKGLDGMADKLDSIGKKMSLGFTTALTAIGVVSVKNSNVQAQAESKVQTALRATQGAAKLTFEQLSAYASELQGKSLFGDEKILADSTAVLLKFTNIAGNEFKRVQAAALDLSQDLGVDLKSASIQLGKALNDPVKNLSALSRMGIQFSKEQTATIRTLVETNRLAEAQGLILDDLASKYGGQAEAAAKAGTGVLKQLSNNWGDFLERIGKTFQPVINQAGQFLNRIVDGLNNMHPTMLKTVVIIAAIVAGTGPLLVSVGTLIKLLPVIKAGFMALFAPIAGVQKAVVGLSAAIAANPIGLLLTLLSAGVGIFLAFGRGAKDAARDNGELTNKVIEESRQVNTLIAKLSSATTAEKERKEALQELKRIQPDIVDGLNAESIELETLKKRAAEYNQQLVLRIALARKQDQVADAIGKQTEAGIKQAEKEAELFRLLGDFGERLQTSKIEVGQLNVTQGITHWRKVTDEERQKIIANYAAIMASGDDLVTKAEQISRLTTQSPDPLSTAKYRGLNARDIRSAVNDIKGLTNSVSEAGQAVENAESDVRNFAAAFSMSLQNAIDGTAGATDEMANASDRMGSKIQKSIAELNQEIQDLQEQKKNSLDTQEIEDFNRKIASLQNRIDGLNSLGTRMQETKGKIVLLGEEIEKLEKLKKASFDVAEIAEYNKQIDDLKKQIEELNKVRPREILPSVITQDIKPVEFPIKLKPLDIKGFVSDSVKKMQEVRAAVTEKIYGWAGQISAGLLSEIREVEQIVGNYTDALVAKGWGFAQALDFVASKMAETMQSFDNSLTDFLAKSVTAVAESIGQIIAGDLGFEGLLKAILLQFANFLKQIGAQLIQFGIMIVAFKSALKSVLANPWAAIAVGAAMVAAAALMSSLIQKNAQKNVPKLARGGLAFGQTLAVVGDNPNAKVDPEVIAPLSKLKSFMSAGERTNLHITMSGQLTAKGRDLAYVLGQESYKIEVIG